MWIRIKEHITEDVQIFEHTVRIKNSINLSEAGISNTTFGIKNTLILAFLDKKMTFF